MKTFIKTSTVLAFVFVLSSCHNSRNRKIQYMGDTDMYEAVPYEAYSADHPVFKDGMSAQAPVTGTVARGKVPYDYPDTEWGYQTAKDSLYSPIKATKENLKNGKYLFEMYCAVCHGKTGDGQGALVKKEKFLGVPNYMERDLRQGNIYHVIMYGKGMMGSHASQLRSKERWQVTLYVEQLRKKLLK